MFSGEGRAAANEIFRPRSLCKPLQDEFNCDARAAKDGLAAHDAGDPLNVLLPVHILIIAR